MRMTIKMKYKKREIYSCEFCKRKIKKISVYSIKGKNMCQSCFIKYMKGEIKNIHNIFFNLKRLLIE